MLASILVTAAPLATDDSIDFNRDIRPILSDNCFACHGPDAGHREADLRLDRAEGVGGVEGAHGVIVPGDPDGSLLIRRIEHRRERSMMPPPESGLELTEDEKSLLRRWIEDGAAYERHWSFVAPTTPPIAAMDDDDWSTSEIDRFVLRRLESEGLRPAPRASRETLLRRVTLDLTGLPPTIEELDAFLADSNSDAWARVVDRLLASPRYGERMALPWLDAARYADTNGFSIDDHRDMWLWREWVIDAYNRNLPYDQFVTEQIAGDLLPNATDSERLATGFLRNSMNTHEGGTIPEEYRVIYIADKIDTVSTAFMGLTFRCAQCHDHKYDPVSQEEYFQFYAFFDTAHEPGMGATNANTPPVIRMDGPLTDGEAYRRDLEARIATLRRYRLHPPELLDERASWEADMVASAEADLLDALRRPVPDRTDNEWRTINEAFGASTVAFGHHVKTIDAEIRVLEADLEAGRASVMVMQEEGPRQTWVLTRGDYDKPDTSRPVEAGVPAVLPPMRAAKEDGPATRLDLARWLTRPDHPLTARVAVNRTWQVFFGRGLVATPGDFGAQGAYPSHPELLDWLATEYVRSGWDTKHLVRTIVMSSTYRQSSESSSSAMERDPMNTLLGRAPRVRLPAEFIRDGALAMSGRLDPRVGGPSVYPAQPHGLWREVSHFGYEHPFTAQAFYPSDPAAPKRRSMYTFWKRTSPPPSLVTFDAPSREVCVVERSRTNTPLQALVLLNDPEMIETARAIAVRTIEHGGTDDTSRINWIFRLATAREPTDRERSVLIDHLGQARDRYERESGATRAIALADDPALAAWTSIATIILNLDETITRE